MFKYVCHFCVGLYKLRYGIALYLVLVYRSLIMPVLNYVLCSVAAADSLYSFVQCCPAWHLVVRLCI